MNERTVKKLAPGGWESVAHEDIKDGDIIRMFEPDGTVVRGLELGVVCTSDSFCVDGVWGVRTTQRSGGFEWGEGWLDEILDQADEAVKEWPEWMQAPEMRYPDKKG